MLTHSRKYKHELQSAPLVTTAKGKVSTKSDEIAYGRTAAVLGWARSDFPREVEDEVLGYAIEAYEQRMIKLHGAPF